MLIISKHYMYIFSVYKHYISNIYIYTFGPQVRAFAFAQGGLVAAARLHEDLLRAVVAAPAAFFDATPAGRVLNRFSSDAAIADDALPFILSAPHICALVLRQLSYFMLRCCF